MPVGNGWTKIFGGKAQSNEYLLQISLKLDTEKMQKSMQLNGEILTEKIILRMKKMTKG